MKNHLDRDDLMGPRQISRAIDFKLWRYGLNQIKCYFFLATGIEGAPLF
jgi:hypothetical protein